jgi:hypothetical protein
MNPAQVREKIAVLERQIELIEEFLKQRKEFGKDDHDLQADLKRCRAELDELRLNQPVEKQPEKTVAE